MKKVFAVFLLLLGVGMVACGFYYDEISEMLGIKETKEERKFPEFIKCVRKKENFEAQLDVDEESTMYFNTRGELTSIEDEVVLSPIDNSSEARERLTKYYTKMDEVLNSFYTFKGFSEKHSNEDKKINYSMDINLKKFSNTKDNKEENVDTENTPDAENNTTVTTDEDGNVILDFVSVDKEGKAKFSYKDKYKEVKEKREKSGFICN